MVLQTPQAILRQTIQRNYTRPQPQSYFRLWVVFSLLFSCLHTNSQKFCLLWCLEKFQNQILRNELIQANSLERIELVLFLTLEEKKHKSLVVFVFVVAVVSVFNISPQDNFSLYFSPSYVYEIKISNEDRHVWKMYLQKKMFDAAISYCKNNWQRDIVRIAQAEDCFNAREYEQAAVFYAMTSKSFEEITLKFIHINQRDALKTFSSFHFPFLFFSFLFLFCSY